MICDAITCAGCRYLEQDEQDDQATSFAEFLANCQHAKCKVVRLVRQQISKLQNTQYEHFPIAGDAHDEIHEESKSESSSKMHEEPHREEDVHEIYGEIHKPYNDVYEVEGGVQTQDKVYEMQKPVAIVKQTVGMENAITNITTASFHRAASPGRAVDRKWMLWILDRVRHRAHLILAAAVVGVIAWTALVYGVFLGATTCGSGRTCFASSLKYTHAKRSLF
ncbi:uncharacterized protein [Linepithema humile]|uniref:uncharacterized protein n=1 Tax=Linepithema humile TaxID=83485 RepID=UPI0006238EEC|nr:PREDICTED: uncharacterized protein LOC105670721 [Linepithema humile]